MTRRQYLIVALCVLFAFKSSMAAGAEKLTVTATQPWLALLASFIGGANVNVVPLQEWNAEGNLVRSDRGRTLKELPEDARVIALDLNDARNTGLKEGAYPNLRSLYSPFPIVTSNIDAALSDPSVLPFVAQRVLTVLSEWDPSNYPYYQRRLAEFQARLSSSVLAGQQVLRGVPVCDLTASSGALLQAARCKIERPAPQQITEWTKGNHAGLRKLLDAKKSEGMTVVMDRGTPAPLRKILSGRPEVFCFERPALNQDYPAFLHEQYISLWQKITVKPSAAASKSNGKTGTKGRRN